MSYLENVLDWIFVTASASIVAYFEILTCKVMVLKSGAFECLLGPMGELSRIESRIKARYPSWPGITPSIMSKTLKSPSENQEMEAGDDLEVEQLNNRGLVYMYLVCTNPIMIPRAEGKYKSKNRKPSSQGAIVAVILDLGLPTYEC